MFSCMPDFVYIQVALLEQRANMLDQFNDDSPVHVFQSISDQILFKKWK